MRKKLSPKLTPEQKAELNKPFKLATLSEETFLKIGDHFIGLLHTMPMVLPHLINDDYDAQLGLVYGFDTPESAEHAFSVLKSPALFWGCAVEFDRKMFPKNETGLDFDHYAIYVRRQ